MEENVSLRTSHANSLLFFSGLVVVIRSVQKTLRDPFRLKYFFQLSSNLYRFFPYINPVWSDPSFKIDNV